ncbi:flotillin-like FloA family protein [Bremerella sp. JC817]|uniref:flotillin-like FloA family protein n=1 Tax=Bremerella sp. JC817 TaxID=3231756 RepID=UPI003459AB48
MYVVWSLAIATAIGLVLVGYWYFQLWIQAYSTGTGIRFLDLVFMSLRQVNPRAIVECKIMVSQSGMPAIETRLLEAQYLAGGDIRRVTLAVIAADRAGIPLDWDTAAAIDLAGRDILEAVKTSVDPKVIVCPDPKDARSDVLFGIARDGIQLKVCVLVTVRTNLAQLVGGATESTIIARVGQSVISAIGTCEHYHEALRDPMLITRKVLSEKLDANTAFAIVSIDIAEIEVGQNIGARLQIDQADADYRVAMAFAEQRRAMAIARHQEMRAKCSQSQVRVVLAEAAIPKSMAEAFRAGGVQSDQKRPKPQKVRSPFPHLKHLAALA